MATQITQSLTLRTFVFLFVICHSSFWANGQKQGNVWHFGDGRAVDFSSGEPVSVTGSQVFTPEGSAAYCDPAGNLLFYTNGGGREPAFSGQDGGHIWNRLNVVMYDMQGIEGGGFSAEQSSVIVEAPGLDSVYYVFTMDEIEWSIGASPAVISSQPGGRGLSYFTVDMRLNGGLGGVVLADQRVFSPSYEGLCAIRHANGRDYWLIIHQGNQGLGVYSLTPAGLSLAGTFTALGESGDGIKASPDGTLVVVQFRSNPHVLRFDPLTGQLSVASEVPGLTSRCEFSPNSRFLYALQTVAAVLFVRRYDLQANNIAASATTIGPFSFPGDVLAPGQMQLGPDGRVYFLAVDLLTGAMRLHRINCPNTSEASIALNVLSFISGNTFFGLPNYSAWLFDNEDAAFVSLGPDTLNLCDPSIPLVLDALNPGSSYSWSTGASTQRIVVSEPGTYAVTVTNECGSGADSIVVVSCAQVAVACDVFQYTGALQQWTVPGGVDTIRVKMWGAAGGGGPDVTNNAGGGGGYSELSLPVSAGEVIDIVVGGGGASAQGHTGGAGGWPNGGHGGSGNRVENGINVGGGGGGGGRSQISRAGVLLAIAGGGGGSAYNRGGGGGGGLDANFTVSNNSFSVNGFGGTQTAGGAPGNNSICGNPVQGTAGAAQQGGTGATDLGGNNIRTGGGGGGDGYFGGGGGSSHDGCFGVGSTGGGGSGYLCDNCPGLSGNTITAGFAGMPANASDPLLASFPGIAKGSDNRQGGHGLVQICYNPCNPTRDSISLSSCGPYSAPSGAVFSVSGVYADTLVNAAGCDSILQINLTVNSIPSVTITGGDVVCNGQALLLTATLTGVGENFSFSWSGGDTVAFISVATAGDYSVTVSNVCGNSISSVSVTTALTPEVSITASDTLCEGIPERLLTNAVGADLYQWSTGASTPDIVVSSGGLYAVTVTNACGSSSDSVMLQQLFPPEVRLLGDSEFCSGDSIRLMAMADNADNYTWTFGSSTAVLLNDSTLTVRSGGLYLVTVANTCGQETAALVVTEFSDCGQSCRYFVPNAFSPNDDGINDDFGPFSNCVVDEYELLIFNRWGGLLYRSTSSEVRWDGRFKGADCPADVYGYLLKYTFRGQVAQVVSGEVVLVR